ncbi:MAG: hypothetical protein V1685_00330, partial [Parcubacteria group bacterium]
RIWIVFAALLIICSSAMLTLQICLKYSSSGVHLQNFPTSTQENQSLAVTIATDSENYQKGGQIHLYGTVNSSGSPVQSGTVEIILSSGSWKRPLISTFSSGAYSIYYTVSFGDPDGTWTITAEATDASGNTGENTDNIYVSIPSDTVYYTVTFLSPAVGRSYNRGDEISITVQVTQAEMAVEGAQVSCRLPLDGNLVLTESSPGRYSTTYKFQWDDLIENWYISAEAKKTVSGSLMAGGNYIGFELEPAVLRLDLLSPAKHEFSPDEKMSIRVGVVYPDSTPVENGTVIVSTPAGWSLTLAEEGNGIYGTLTSSISEDVGSGTLRVTVTDSGGNTGSTAYTVAVVPKSSSLYPVYILLNCGIIVGVGIPVAIFARWRSRHVTLEAIECETKEIKRLEKEAFNKYFKKGAISRQIYDELMQRHNKRLTELRRRRDELSKKKR